MPDRFVQEGVAPPRSGTPPDPELVAELERVRLRGPEALASFFAGVAGVVGRVHVPLLRRGLLTALVLVFVDTMKEMPATLLLRPFGFTTLAVEVWERTSESLWAEAAVPALAIVIGVVAAEYHDNVTVTVARHSAREYRRCGNSACRLSSQTMNFIQPLHGLLCAVVRDRY